MAGKHVRRIIRLIGNTATVIALIILVGGTAMMIADIRPAIVMSGSMEPAIHTGSMVLVDKNEHDIKPRDIIAFESGGAVVVHRAIRVSEKGIVTKGDANDCRDPGIVSTEQLKGKVILWVPYAGYAAAAFGSVPGIIVMLSLCMLMTVLYHAGDKEAGTDGRNKNTAGSDGSAA